MRSSVVPPMRKLWPVVWGYPSAFHTWLHLARKAGLVSMHGPEGVSYPASSQTHLFVLTTQKMPTDQTFDSAIRTCTKLGLGLHKIISRYPNANRRDGIRACGRTPKKRVSISMAKVTVKTVHMYIPGSCYLLVPHPHTPTTVVARIVP